jgi:type IV pilus assembly protein PilE
MLTGKGLPKRSRGFTLIEVIIVIVIVGILMAVALPGYQDSMRKGRRADAKAALMDAANRQEGLMLDRSTYTLDMAELGLGSEPVKSAEGHYFIDAEPEDANCPIATCYVLTATPVPGGAQADDSRCTSFSVTSAGAKTATGSAGSECW